MTYRAYVTPRGDDEPLIIFGSVTDRRADLKAIAQSCGFDPTNQSHKTLVTVDLLDDPRSLRLANGHWTVLGPNAFFMQRYWEMAEGRALQGHAPTLPIKIVFGPLSAAQPDLAEHQDGIIGRAVLTSHMDGIHDDLRLP
ncbi:hypothetical protein [Catenuloplanes japonicus]|uniref:hypothetical protein n=1 Tax=Catenuloplanes japonicus TaxID=33876 RepID=UPI000AA71D25|nr:hypothetical protein [Catenuloplanes japonicus]